VKLVSRRVDISVCRQGSRGTVCRRRLDLLKLSTQGEQPVLTAGRQLAELLLAELSQTIRDRRPVPAVMSKVQHY